MNTGIIARILNIKDEFLTNHEFRRYFRLRIRNNISDLESELPSVPSIAMGPAIDENTIIKLNQLMSNEGKTAFLKNVLNCKNIDFNVYFLILNSSDDVKKYIIEILSHSVLGMSTLNLHFYDIANIYLYILANSETYTCKEVLQHLKKGMLIYEATALDHARELKIFQDELFKRNDVIINKIKETVIEYKEDNILDILKLRTDEQLEQHKNDFFKQLEDKKQEAEDKNLKTKKILKILGISVICQIALVAFGFPPCTRIVNKTIKTLLDFDNS